MSTIFHKIVAGEVPCYKIYEDDKFLAFLDVNAVTEGHTLVIPKKAYEKVWDLPGDEIGEYFKVCKKIANHFQSLVGKDSVYSMVIGEDVPYAHIHIVPDKDRKFVRKIVEALDEKTDLLENADLAAKVQQKFAL